MAQNKNESQYATQHLIGTLVFYNVYYTSVSQQPYGLGALKCLYFIECKEQYVYETC